MNSPDDSDSIDDWFEYAVDLPETQRAALLARLRAEDPRTADRLERALRDQLANFDFATRAVPAAVPDRLRAVTLPVDDVAEAVRWYGNVFQCRVVQQDKHRATLDFDGVLLQFVARHLEPPSVTIVRTDVRRMGAAERRPGGGHVLRLVDPFGNAIEAVDDAP